MNGDNWKEFFYVKQVASGHWAIYNVNTDRSINNTYYYYEYNARKAAKLITYNINKRAEKALLK